MTIKLQSVELENGKTRRLAIDSEAPNNPSKLENDLFRDYPKKCVAFWDVRDVDGVRKATFILVRPDLQGQGYLRKLAPAMSKQLGDTPLELVNIISPAVEVLKTAMEETGSSVSSVTGGQ